MIEFNKVQDTLYEMNNISVQIEASAFVLYVIVAEIQLALRHPQNNGRTAQTAEKFARQTQAALSERFPDIAELLEAGWNMQYDM